MSSSRMPVESGRVATLAGGSQAAALRQKIEDRTARIGVIGLGYVGLPMTLTMAEKGYTVIGFDVDPAKIEALNQGRNYIQHLDGKRLTEAVGSGKFRATADFRRLSEPDAMLICVPTPL